MNNEMRKKEINKTKSKLRQTKGLEKITRKKSQKSKLPTLIIIHISWICVSI
jgi:hypothetical protein